MISARANPFHVVTDRVPLGTGHLVIDRFEDGEVVAATIVGDVMTRSLRPLQLHAIRVFTEHLGEVVPYADLLPENSKQDSLRRDLGDLRSTLEDLGIEIDVVPHVGYRLRDAHSEPATISIGDLTLDVAGRVVACRGRRRLLGDTTTAMLKVMADGRPRDAASLYELVWGGQPFAVADIVAGRIAALRDVLREIGSRSTIQTWTVHTPLARGGRYFLRLPDRALRSPSRPMLTDFTRTAQIELGLAWEADQLSLFDPPEPRNVAWARTRRLSRRELIIADRDSMMPMWFVETTDGR